jgi:hypothetical protein
MRLEGMAAKEPSAAEPQPKGIENAEAAETQRSRARHEIYAACGIFRVSTLQMGADDRSAVAGLSANMPVICGFPLRMTLSKRHSGQSMICGIDAVGFPCPSGDPRRDRSLQ